MAVEKGKVPQNEDSTEKTGQDSAAEEMLSRSEVEALIAERMSQSQAPGGITNEVAEALKAMAAATAAQAGNQSDESFDPFKYLSPAIIAEDDMLDEPVTFWANKFMLVIGDDKKGNKAIPAPYGRILFSSDGWKKNHGGKGVDIVHWSKYTCFSKRELKFLKEHTYLGVLFFEAKSDKIEIDAQAAMLMASLYTSLKQTPAFEVFKQMRDHNLAHTTDENEARMILAKYHADKQIKAIKDAEKVQLGKNKKVEMLVEQSQARG